MLYADRDYALHMAFEHGRSASCIQSELMNLRAYLKVPLVHYFKKHGTQKNVRDESDVLMSYFIYD